MYGVFDGHGQQGHAVSNFAKENFPKIIIKDRRLRTAETKPMLHDVFKKMQSLVRTADRMKKISAQLSGTTCSLAIHNHIDDTLTIAHVANSTVVLGSFIDEQKSRLAATQLTRNHRPEMPDERARIEKNGGRIVFDGHASHRVYANRGRYPGITMSRSIGDLLGHQDAGITCEPEVTTVQLKPLDHMLLLCSDGVWDVITPEEAVNIMSEFNATTGMQAADKLAQEAWDRWNREEGGAYVDDITVIVVFLKSSTLHSRSVEHPASSPSGLQILDNEIAYI